MSRYKTRRSRQASARARRQPRDLQKRFTTREKQVGEWIVKGFVFLVIVVLSVSFVTNSLAG